MSNFHADMKEVTERFNKWAETNPILNDEFTTVDGLIQRHHDDRGRLFEEMLEAMKRDKDIVDRWQSVCDKGLDLHERLNSAIGNQVSGGFGAIGMSDFYEGEKKIWQAAKGGAIPAIAESICEIGQHDDALTRQLEEDLKKAREDGKVADELVRTTFRSTGEAMRTMSTQAAQEGAGKLASKIPFIGEKLAPYATAFVQALTGGSATAREQAKRKRVYKDVLIKNRDMIDKVRDQLNDDNIKNVYQKGCELANSLKGAGSSGYYRATDWESFGKACCERLRDHADPAMEKARKLYQTVHPAYVEGITGAFATLSSDQASLDAFKGELNEATQQLFEELRKDDEVINLLRDGEPKRSAQRQMKEIQDSVTEAIKNLKDAIREAEETMKV